MEEKPAYVSGGVRMVLESGAGRNARQGQLGLGLALLGWVLGRWQAGAAGAWLSFAGLGPRQVAAGAAGARLGFAGLGPWQVGQDWAGLGLARLGIGLWLELALARTWLGREGWGLAWFLLNIEMEALMRQLSEDRGSEWNRPKLNRDIDFRKEVEAFRANKAMETEENLNEMLDSNEAGGSAHSQSQAWLLDKVEPQFVNLTNVNSLGECVKKLVNMATFCSLRGWFESLELEDYEPFDWEEYKGKRKA
ncbi:hypothetical protein BY996DRAFT_6543291 [Phakopsora pachyrhizi]|nr:hypothetical protein BY996DRAFT_6543291 [Phakopsora pachyrhizi]